MTPYLVALPSAQGSTATLGGKGFQLQRLMEHGLPVPPACVIPADAYRVHVAQRAVRTLLVAALTAPPSVRAASLGDVRAAIIAAPLDNAVRAAVVSAVAHLGDGPLAVRSSATTEDGARHSFAGQHDTLLGVRGVEACGDAVRRCWASLWSERAAAYRAQHGLGAEAAMAVVLQQCVSAEVAGVLFTRDPLGRHADRLVIEAVFGLGEILVSGRVTPQRWVIHRTTRAVIEHTHAPQPFEMVADAAGGTRERPLTAARLARPCLTVGQAQQLADCGLAVERVFGGPQDVEWARAGEQVFLLQSRPVTTTAAPADFADRQVWANTNTAEILPDVLRPMSFAVLQHFLNALVRRGLTPLGFTGADVPLVDLIAGRAYFNMNTFAALLRPLPFVALDPASAFGGDKELLAAINQLQEGDLPRTTTSIWRLLQLVPGVLGWLLHSNTRADVIMGRLRTTTAALENVDLAGLSDAAVLARVDYVFGDIDSIVDGLFRSMVGLACAAGLSAVCRRWLGDGDGAMAGRLLSGMGGLDSADAGLDLWRLADAARTPPVSDAIATGARFAQVGETLGASEAGRAFLVQWERFMARHGHHTRVEVDVALPRWHDEPDYVLDMIRSYGSDARHSPVRMHQQRGAERAALTAACRARLRQPRRRLFDGLLAWAQRGTALRENVKSEGVRRIALARAALLELGARLVARGVCADRDDIFFLTIDEARDVVHGGARIDAAAAVRGGRAAYAANLALAPAPVIVGRFDARRHQAVPAPLGATASVLRGLAVSPGVARGPARVILRADAEQRVRPGEILVAPFTDPGWTPYFLPAAGIVMDVGGALSHGSIVAREYGIPAVVNVGPATQIIRTGEIIEVDGHRGEVRRLSDATVA